MRMSLAFARKLAILVLAGLVRISIIEEEGTSKRGIELGAAHEKWK